MGDLEILHDVLLACTDFESSHQRVKRFFDRTTLIRYDKVFVLEDGSINGTEDKFRQRLAEGLDANYQVLKGLLENMKDEGFANLNDFQGLEKGNISKVFHTVAHLLDSFIGIDSRFYNLEEDSHTISHGLHRKILAEPHNYWIIRVKGVHRYNN